ncbi:MAG: hypothetical protein OEV64_08675, partial [Desulfobulbaceae bacterium]|nr:hypothetical protein [Desulfobulbaceae bacterium]
MSKKIYRPQVNKADRAKPMPGKDTPITYAELLRPLIPRDDAQISRVTAQSAPLVHLDYTVELKVKEQALAEFWRQFKLPGNPGRVIASPKERNYRTTSKRKTVLKGKRLFLLFGDKVLASQKMPFVESPLEPKSHARIYSFLQGKLSEPLFKMVAAHLNYLIIRGS